MRIGNAAVDQVQHDAYGSVILAATPMFFDRRLPRPGDAALFRLLEPLASRRPKLALEPDAGIWEYRGRKRVHTHSAAMCWAGCQRLAAIAANLGLRRPRALLGRAPPTKIGEDLLAGRLESQSARPSPPPSAATIWTPASCCLPELGLIAADDPRFVATVDGDRSANFGAVCHVMRYAAEDDFGLPETAFLICRFWLIDALWEIGRREEARDCSTTRCALRNRYGLLSEDIHPADRKTVGQFSADLFHGGIDFQRDASCRAAGKTAIGAARRNLQPRWRARWRARTPAGWKSAIRPTLQQRAGVWLGWSGASATAIPGPAKTTERNNVSTSPSDCARTITRNSTTALPTACCGRSCITGSIWPNSPAAISAAISGSTSIFASDLEKVLRPDDVVWVHDYHLIPLAKALRERGHKNRIGFFLHIPCRRRKSSPRCPTTSS